jgi:ankyrin repeat protein
VDSGIVDVLIEEGADVDAVDAVGRTPLHYASAEGYEAIVGTLLAAGARTDLEDEDGATPADLADARGFEGVLGILRGAKRQPPVASQEAEPRWRGSGEGRYGAALRRAAAAGDVAEVRRLLARGAEPDAQAPRNRKTALHLAAAAGHAAVVRTLLAGGAHVEAQDSDGFTPAQRARENGHDEIVRLLEAAAF